MKAQIGDFWFKIKKPNYLYEVTSLNYVDDYCIESICSLWMRFSTGKYIKIKDNVWVIVYKHEFKDWQLINFGV